MVPHALRETLLACGLYSFSSVSLSLCNKLAFSGPEFNLPLAILAFQALVAMILVKCSNALGLTERMPIRLDLLWRMLPVTLLFCAMLWTSGKALRHCSMPMVTVFKNVAVLGTTLWEAARYGQRISAGVAAALAMMVGGSAAAGVGDMSADGIGLSWMLANIACTVAYLAVLKERMPDDVPSASKTLHNQLVTLLVFAATAAHSGQLRAFRERLPEQPFAFQLGMLATGLLGTALNVSTFWCLRVTSGATYAFVGATNKIPQALLGHVIFQSVITPTGWCGVTIGLCAGLLYAIAKQREQSAAATEPGAEELRGILAHSDALDEADPGGGAAQSGCRALALSRIDGQAKSDQGHDRAPSAARAVRKDVLVRELFAFGERGSTTRSVAAAACGRRAAVGLLATRPEQTAPWPPAQVTRADEP